MSEIVFAYHGAATTIWHRPIQASSAMHWCLSKPNIRRYGDIISCVWEASEQWDCLKLVCYVLEFVWLQLLQTRCGTENGSSYYGLKGFTLAFWKSLIWSLQYNSSLTHVIAWMNDNSKYSEQQKICTYCILQNIHTYTWLPFLSRLVYLY